MRTYNKWYKEIYWYIVERFTTPPKKEAPDETSENKWRTDAYLENKQ